MKDTVKEKKNAVDHKFRDNKEARRYEMDLDDGYIALINYFVTPSGDIALTHTEVTYEFEGMGIGTELVEKCLEDIKDKGAKVIPQCGFVASYIRRHPQWQDMVARRY